MNVGNPFLFLFQTSQNASVLLTFINLRKFVSKIDNGWEMNYIKVLSCRIIRNLYKIYSDVIAFIINILQLCQNFLTFLFAIFVLIKRIYKLYFVNENYLLICFSHWLLVSDIETHRRKRPSCQKCLGAFQAFFDWLLQFDLEFRVYHRPLTSSEPYLHHSGHLESWM